MNRRRTLMWQKGVVVAALALPLMLPPLASSVRAASYAEDRLFVVVPDSVRPLTITVDSLGNTWTGYDCLDSLNVQHSWIKVYKSFPHPSHDSDGIYSVVVLGPENMDSVVADYANSGCVDHAYKMLAFELVATPNDSLYLYDTASGQYQWGLDAFHSRVDQVWEITTGSPDLVVAVIDGGLFWEHPDLIDNIWINEEEDSNGNGTFEPWPSDSSVGGVYGDLDGDDDDGNGYVDDVVGIKAVDGGFDPDVRNFDIFPHGTFTSGVVGARTNNTEGIAGTAGGWEPVAGVKVMGVTVEGLDQHFQFDNFYNAIEYAVNAASV